METTQPAEASEFNSVMVVDDDPIGRATIGGLLRKQGCQVRLSQSGAEALEQALAQPPDLMLLDVMMHGMDGIEVCQRIRAEPRLAEVPIIMLTSLDDRALRLRSIEAGADDFITKPIDVIELLARVRGILRLNRYRRLLTERSQRQHAEQQMLQRNRELSLLNHIVRAAAAQPRTIDDLVDITREACQTLLQVFGLSSARAGLLDEAGRDLIITLAIGGDSGRVPVSFDLPYGRAPGVRPWLIEEPQHEPRLSQHSAVVDGRTRQILVVPVQLQSRFTGAIELHLPTPRRFEPRDLDFAQSVATALAQAIESVWLHRQIQRQVISLEEIVAARTTELRAAHDRTSAILGALGEAVFVTEPDFTVSYMNRAGEQLTGYTLDELAGQSWAGLQPAELADRYAEIRATVCAGATWRGELPVFPKSGSSYSAAMTVAPIWSDGAPAKIIGFVAIQRNISPLKAAERAKDEFISNISHELRTPLSVIALHSGNLDTLYPRLSDAQRRRMISQIRDQVDLLDALISDVLVASRIDNDAEQPNLSHVNLAALLPSEADHQRPLLTRKGQQLSVEHPPSLPVEADERQIRQVLRNLINNAIKYTPAAGAIRCRADVVAGGAASAGWPGSAALASGRWAAIQIADTGVGIAAADQPHLFERFFRVHNQISTPGTGLGLAIARTLIERNHGAIAVESTPGVGSTFAIYLPLAGEPRAP